jgi:protein SCO1
MHINNSSPVIIILLLFLAGCNPQIETLPFYNSADFTAEWISKNEPAYKNIHTIDTFAMQNQLGHLITKDSLDGNIYVANFFFTICPGICPKMVSNLELLQDTFANNPKVKLVSFSVMPWVDSVERLRVYGENHNINPSKWFLLTGNKERIYKLGRQSYFSEKRLGLQKNSSEFLHTESMLLIDNKGRIRGIYNATDKKEIDRVSGDIKLLLKE